MTSARPDQPTEAERIRAAYARRDVRGRYAFFNRARRPALQEVEREMLTLLGRALGAQAVAAVRRDP